MESTTNENGTISSVVAACLADERERLIAGDLWDCLVAARGIATLLGAEGRRPWIARLRRTEQGVNGVYHAPLVAWISDRAVTWTTHYVCCCEGMAYDPVAGRTLPIESYSRDVFGEDIPLERLALPDELAA